MIRGVLVLALVAVGAAGCNKTPAPVPTEASAPKRAGPDLLTAVRVDVRRTSDADGTRGDVVVGLTRAGDHFDWDGKGVPFPNTLGERAGDPRTHPRCACDVSAACPRCDGVAASDLVRKSGTLAAASVEAFLGEVMRHEKGDAGDAGASWPRHVDMVHVAITLPGADEPIHVSYFDSHHAWMRDDQPLLGDTAALDAAWNGLAAKLGLDGWLASMSPPVVTSLPADFSALPSAAELEIHDQWNGLGKTHDAVIRLARSSAGFAWRAKVASWSGSLGESTPDPYDPKEKDRTTCTCAVDDTCPCEHGNGVAKKGTVAAAKVEAFLRTISTHAIDPAPPDIGRVWTDDYPKGHVVVWVTKTGTPIHLSFLDQQRQWRADGRVLSPDPAPPATRGEPRSQHTVINAAYQDMLHAIGLDSWIDDIRPARPRRRVR